MFFSLAAVEVGEHFYWNIAGFTVHGQVLLVTWLVIAIILTVAVLGTSNLEQVPKGLQNFVESVYEYTADIAKDQIGEYEYEKFLLKGDKDFKYEMPKDEWQAISLNYTSGTTGRPKGVVYHHRGSYLMSMGSVTAWNMPNRLTYLYTVPMFHCNGWGYPWTLALLHAKIILIRNMICISSVMTC